MAFLDNSGDIILDAVLTDAGRKRLARGDGTFKVSKYSFGDDEIDYSSYNPDHEDGSAYYDLEILQTPILEAFTNNRSSLKSRLITVTNNNLLYLPEMILNEVADKTSRPPTNALCTGSFLVVVDETTRKALDAPGISAGFAPIAAKNDWINGFNLSDRDSRMIRVDQGLNTDKLDAVNSLSAELTEQQYMIQIDNRLGSISDLAGTSNAQASPSFIDDDQIATYYVTTNVGNFVQRCTPGNLTDAAAAASNEVLPGPRGTKLQFGVYASAGLKSSTYLFDTIGTTGIVSGGTYTNDFSVINTTVKVTGITTGYSIDIPITFARSTTSNLPAAT